MNTTAIKNFAQRARREFRKLVTDKAHALGIGKNEIAKATEHGDALVIHGQAFAVSIKRQREELIAAVQQQGFDHVFDAMAYTLFNRLCALRFMEVHNYLPQRVLSAKDGGGVPDILRNAVDVVDKLFSDPKARKDIKELKLSGTQDQELYRRLILAQCNALASAMPFLFETQQDYSELLMPDNLLHSDSVVRDMVKSIDEGDWREIEIIGWLYQFYVSERKDEVIGSVVEKEDIPAATQLFTPKWIVRYMVENSLGRLWLESHPDSPLNAKMPYFIENPDHNKTPPAKRFDTPDEIKCMDDACGSGHILVYKFDLLYQMYAECGYPKTEIPALILKNNLYGLDIDERAVQLASFALMMKAREKDARFLEKGVFPNVIAIQESNDIDLDAMFNIGVRDTSDRSPFDDPNRLFPDQGLLRAQKTSATQDEKAVQRYKSEFQSLAKFFHDARNFGSLLIVPDALKGQLQSLRKVIHHIEHSAQLFDRRIVVHLQMLVRQADLLASSFDVCVTNPPYMGGTLNPGLSEFMKCHFPHTKSDLSAAFIERALEYCSAEGYVSLVTMHSWMFISSLEAFRRTLLSHHSIKNLVHHGIGAFPSLNSKVVQTAAFTLRRGRDSERPVFVDIRDVAPPDKEAESLLKQKTYATLTNDQFLALPSAVVAYWLSPAQVAIFGEATPLSKVTQPRAGISTGDNERFIRLWWEVPHASIALGAKGRIAGKKFYPHNKAGGFRKWAGYRDFVLKYDDAAMHDMLEKPGFRHDNAGFYFKPSVSWGKVTSGAFSARVYPEGFTFDSAGLSIFASNLIGYLGLLNSVVFSELIAAVSQTLNFTVGDIGNFPIVSTLPDVRKEVQQALAIAQTDWNNVETSWDFKDLPLLRSGIETRTLADSWQSYADYCVKNIQRLQAIETENNRLFIEAYRLQDELKPEVPEDQITLARPDVGKDIKAFISYAIGCMMGRYSLSKPGLQFAGGEWDEAKFKGSKFKPDPDGILPVLNDAYCEDDPTERLAEFLVVTFGKETLNDNLQFVAQTLGMKGNESSRDTIRRYIAEGFFRDHLRTYKKRPIYWLVSSGKERAFQALVYMHRYTPATLSRMRTTYLHELQNKLNARVDEVQRSIDEVTSTAQFNRLSKELIRIKRQQAELLAFDEKLNNIASKKITIDLDDGVKHNYGLFGDLLAEVKTVCGKDEE